MKHCTTIILLLLFFQLNMMAQSKQRPDTIADQQLDEVQVVQRRQGIRRMSGAVGGQLIDRNELFRAACCNLGESFATNPSVDVNYDDATTGARQIRLLGLSGTYVQMMTENLPSWRGATMPYALGYVPGTWMKSIQVSKGTASVRNGYEAITGQINVEYLLPEDKESANLNLYGDTQSRLEANFDANHHFTKQLSTILLAHFENRWGHHDSNNDGFQDMPSVRQYNLMNRWAYLGDRYIFHGGLSFLDEHRQSGQAMGHHQTNPYTISLDNRHYNIYSKHAYIFDKSTGTNVALMMQASVYDQEARYGTKSYWLNQQNQYLQLMFETNLREVHNLSAGLTLNHDNYHQHIENPSLVLGNSYLAPRISPLDGFQEEETALGGYLQYTLNLSNRFILMAGLRLDNLHTSNLSTLNTQHSTVLVTPRAHLKWQPSDLLTLRLSAGTGSRTPHPLAEQNYLFASGRTLEVPLGALRRETGYNLGASAQVNIPVANDYVRLNMDYYYTRFQHQLVVDYDATVTSILLNPDAHGYSHAFQVDATYQLFRGFLLTTAFRRNFVKATYGGRQQMPPLVSKYKGLLTASYKTRLELWQVDVTLQQNGGGRLPESTGATRFHAYEQLSAQITRNFRHYSVYFGGENLTSVKQRNPIINASDPWSTAFEPTLVWGPIDGAMAYVGIRWKLK